MKKLLMFAAFAVVLCSCGSGNSMTGTHEGYEWVDLGLSVKWATCNVGASSPEEYGDYFGWTRRRRDAATANWGGDWRIPTLEELQELFDNCTWEWTTQNGHNGCKFTSKKNGQSIFLPAAGSRDADESNVGSHGYYWSSTPNESKTVDAYSLFFREGFLGLDGRNYKGSGRSVRPVLE